MDNSIDVMERIARLSRLIRRQPADHRISRGGHKLIGVLLEHDGIRTFELAEKLDIRPSSLTDVLKRLENEGLIRREKDESDSRISRVYVSEEARAAYVSNEAAHKSHGEQLSGCLTDEEARTFCGICDKLCEFLKQMPEPPQERCGRRDDERHGHREDEHRHHGKGGRP